MLDTVALNDSLAANYLLVQIEINSWGATVTDKEISQSVISEHNASKDAGKFKKNLFCGADAELREVWNKAALVRQYVYRNTLPWTGDSEGQKRGPRLLAATTSIEFLKGLQAVKADHDHAVAALISVWDARKLTAIANLGGLAKDADYPSIESVSSKFGVSISIDPVPSQKDFNRINVPAPVAAALGQRHAAASVSHAEVAMSELRKRLLESIQRMAVQLGKASTGEKTRLYDSLVTNLQSMTALMRSMNITQSQAVVDLADRIDAELCSQPVSVFRTNQTEAEKVAKAAESIAAAAAVEDIWKAL